MYDFLIDFIPRDDSAMDYNHGAPKAPPYDPVVFMIVIHIIVFNCRIIPIRCWTIQ